MAFISVCISQVCVPLRVCSTEAGQFLILGLPPPLRQVRIIKLGGARPVTLPVPIEEDEEKQELKIGKPEEMQVEN